MLSSRVQIIKKYTIYTGDGINMMSKIDQSDKNEISWKWFRLRLYNALLNKYYAHIITSSFSQGQKLQPICKMKF